MTGPVTQLVTVMTGPVTQLVTVMTGPVTQLITVMTGPVTQLVTVISSWFLTTTRPTDIKWHKYSVTQAQYTTSNLLSITFHRPAIVCFLRIQTFGKTANL